MKSRVLARIICCGLYLERDPFLSEALYVPVQADSQPVSTLERLIESVSDESKSRSISNSESSIRHREAGACIFLILFIYLFLPLERPMDKTGGIRERGMRAEESSVVVA